MAIKAAELNALNAAQLEALIEKAEARQAELKSERLGSVREQIKATLAKEGLALGDLFPSTRRSNRGATKGTSAGVKYKDPKNAANVWSGRGKRPHWLRDAINAGKKLESFLV